MPEPEEVPGQTPAESGATVPPVSPAEETATPPEPATPEEAADQFAPKPDEAGAGETPPAAAPEKTREGEPPAPEATKPPEAEAGKEGQPTPAEAKQEEAALPENVKAAFASAPELRGAYFRDKQLMEVFGTVDNAKFVKEQFEDIQATDKLLFSENPDDHRQFLHNFAEDYPEVYNSLGSIWIRAALNQWGEQARSAGDQVMADALGQAARQFLGDEGQEAGQPAAGQPDALSEVRVQREQFNAEKSAYEQGRARDFSQGVRGEWESKVDAHVTTRLKELLKDGGLSEWAEGNLRRNVMEKLGQKMEADSIFRQRLLSSQKPGDYSDGQRGKLISMLSGHLLPSVDELIASELEQVGPMQAAQAAAKVAAGQERAARGAEPGGGVPSKPAHQAVADMKPKDGETLEEFQDRLLSELEPQPQG
jgi:hypothetical protein